MGYLVWPMTLQQRRIMHPNGRTDFGLSARKQSTNNIPAGGQIAKTSAELTVLVPQETVFAPPMLSNMLLKPLGRICVGIEFNGAKNVT